MCRRTSIFPRPGVVGCCGHSQIGKAEPAYQSFAQGLARLGYVCLIYDPIGQGERLQYVQDDLSSRVGVGVAEHLYAGNQQFLVGEFFGMWRAWDGIRALDYLLTRPEVDPRHLGVTGNSGGGTLTTWLCGLDSRWTMAAPSCFVTTFLHNMENELPADTEQCPPKALSLGLDHVDFLAAMAPKPVAILTQERDFFDVRGSLDAFHRLKHLYQLLGQEQNAAAFGGQGTHGYSAENRRFMYAWFGVATPHFTRRRRARVVLEEDRTLWCTPRGQVSASENTRTVFMHTRDKSQQLATQRGRVRNEALLQAVKSVLKLPAEYAPETRPLPQPSVLRPAPHFRILRSTQETGYPLPYACTYAVVTEPGIMAIVYWLTKESWESRPPQSPADTDGRAILYVAHRSSDRELRQEPLIRDVMQNEPASPVFTCDVRGIGESMPNTCGSEHLRRSVRLRLLLCDTQPDARSAIPRTEDVRRAVRAGLARTPRLHECPSRGERLGIARRDLRCSSVATGDPGDAQELAEILCGSGRIGDVPLAVGHSAAQRAGALRPARLLCRTGSQAAAADRTLGALAD